MLPRRGECLASTAAAVVVVVAVAVAATVLADAVVDVYRPYRQATARKLAGDITRMQNACT